MILHRLRLENFRQHVDSELEFYPGITAIIGPNGSGKTTILEAIGWALYGSTAMRGKNADVRWLWSDDAKQQVRVVLDFALGDRGYRIERVLQSASLIDLTNNKAIATGITAVEQEVERLLGMTCNQFMTSFFARQKELEFMNYQKEKRRDEIAKMLGYDKVSTAIDKLKDDGKALKGEIKGLEQGMGSLDDAKEQAKEAKAAFEASKEEQKAAAGSEMSAKNALDKKAPEVEVVSKKRTESEQVEKELSELTNRRQNLMGAQQTLRKQLQDMQGAVDEFESLKADVEEYRQATERLNHLNSLAEIMKQQAVVEAQLAQIETQIESLEKEIAQLQSELSALKADPLEAATQALEKEQSAWQSERGRLAAELKQAQSDLESVSDRLAAIHEMGAEAPCPVCARPLGDQYKTVKEQREAELAGLKAKIKTLEIKVADQGEPPEIVRLRARLTDSQKAAEIQKEIVQRQTSISKLKTDKAQYTEQIARMPSGLDESERKALHEKADRLKPMYERSIALTGQIQGLSEVESRLRQSEADLKSIAERQESLEKRKSEIGYDPVADEILQKEVRALEQAYNQAHTRLQVAIQKAQSAEASLKNAEQSLNEIEARKARLDAAQKEFAVMQHTNNGLVAFREQLNAEMLPALRQYASEFLSEMTEGRYASIQLDEDLNATLLDDGDLAKAVISGGEEDVLNLSLRLALSRLITERAGQPMSLLALDETFGQLDSERRSSVLNALSALREVFSQIIIISHIEEIIHASDRAIRVSYDHRKGSQVQPEEVDAELLV
ncbi:MAG: SMC family ATPase [Armatimonadetes bacterium]|nr:SMC family ATPase [Armatimonadota bacterium]